MSHCHCAMDDKQLHGDKCCKEHQTFSVAERCHDAEHSSSFTQRPFISYSDAVGGASVLRMAPAQNVFSGIHLPACSTTVDH